MNIQTARHNIKQILHNLDDPSFETNLILQYTLKTSNTNLLLINEISDDIFKKCIKIAKKRALGKPLQHLLSSWTFYNIEINTPPKVFIPRPETELLVDFILKFKGKTNIIDLCTGSGCICAAIAKNNRLAKIKAIDFSKSAVKCAKKNTSPFKKQVQIIHKNIFNKNLPKNFINWAHILVCNPPYLTKEDMHNLQKEVQFDPKAALYGGDDGLIFFEKICTLWKQTIKNLGWIVFEIGNCQKNYVEDILKKNNFINIKTFNDYHQNNRLTVAQNIQHNSN